MKYDYDIDCVNCYKVILYSFVSSTGKYQRYTIKKFYTDDEAISYAREALNSGFRVKVLQINNLVNWWN